MKNNFSSAKFVRQLIVHGIERDPLSRRTDITKPVSGVEFMMKTLEEPGTASDFTSLT